MTQHITINIPYTATATDTGRGSVWASIEQVYKDTGDESAGLNDLYQMLAMAQTGNSAWGYLRKTCPYAVLENGVITIELDFIVWPHDLGMVYELLPAVGTTSEQEILEEYRSFDVPFSGSNSENLPYIYSGTLTPEMPFIKSDGTVLNAVLVEQDGSTVKLSEPCYTVLRADGLVTGHKYTLTMVLTKPDDYKIENLNNTIILSYLDADGESVTETLDIAIPQCVKDMLEQCPDGGTKYAIGCVSHNCDGRLVYAVYYSVCNGQIIKRGWEPE